MFLHVMDKVGISNFFVFFGTYLSSKLNFINIPELIIHLQRSPFVEKWLEAMFIISSTGAALWTVIRIVDWFMKKFKKDKNE